MSIMEKDCGLASECQGTLLFNEPLADCTTWRAGRPAKKLYKPANLVDLSAFPRLLADIEALIYLVQTKFKEHATVELMHEVHLIGDC